jgi:hypothetical protein
MNRNQSNLTFYCDNVKAMEHKAIRINWSKINLF